MLLIALLHMGMQESHAQLLDPIGLTGEPSPEDAICPPGDYSDGAIDESIGYAEGSPVADFTLYSPQGESFTLSAALGLGKPVLLVSGSYTCPVFRNRVPLLNQIHAVLGDQLTVAVVYTAEAHPTDPSPYFGYVNITQANQEQGILYAQPQTYGERLEVIADMSAAMNIGFPLWVDGPCNEWLEHFGPAPNMAYLIQENGTVFSKHPWFNSYPDQIFCDLESLISLPQDPDCGQPTGGSFILQADEAVDTTGDPGETLYAYAYLVNNSGADVVVQIHRTEVDMPQGWTTSLCATVCLLPQVTYTEVLLAPGQEQLYTNYFYTSDIPGAGAATITFTHADDPAQSFTQVFTGSTGAVHVSEPAAYPQVFPNPCSGSLSLAPGTSRYVLSDCSGRRIREGRTTAGQLDLNGLDAGVYFISLDSAAPVRILLE